MSDGNTVKDTREVLTKEEQVKLAEDAKIQVRQDLMELVRIQDGCAALPEFVVQYESDIGACVFAEATDIYQETVDEINEISLEDHTDPEDIAEIFLCGYTNRIFEVLLVCSEELCDVDLCLDEDKVEEFEQYLEQIPDIDYNGYFFSDLCDISVGSLCRGGDMDNDGGDMDGGGGGGGVDSTTIAIAAGSIGGGLAVFGVAAVLLFCGRVRGAAAGNTTEELPQDVVYAKPAV